jgi:hypothetical protein
VDRQCRTANIFHMEQALGLNLPQGYLRTGQILQLLGKDETALGIYEYGLKHVPPGDENMKVHSAVLVCLIVVLTFIHS